MKRGTGPFAIKGRKWNEHAIMAGIIASGAMTLVMLSIGEEELMSILAIVTMLLIRIVDFKGGKEGNNGE